MKRQKFISCGASFVFTFVLLADSSYGAGNDPVSIQCRALIARLVPSATKVSDSEFAKEVSRLYPEMNWLTGEVNATPEGGLGNAQAGSPSEKLFGKKHIEFDRTCVGACALKWVLEGDHEQFARPHPENIKLSAASFQELQAYTRKVLPDEEAVDAMVAYMVINDLGKIKSIVEEVKKRSGIEDVDHDKILLIALQNHPEIAPSFNRLSPKYQRYIIDGLQAQFNIGQFIQGENVPASLKGLAGLEQGASDFYLLHALFDIAGAAGHVNPNGSVVMTEPTYRGFNLAIKALEGLNKGRSLKQVYDDFLSERAKGLGLTIDNPLDRAVTRVSLMVRASSPAQAAEVKSVFTSLPANAQEILLKELNASGVDDGFATLLYYSPAMLANAQAALKTAGDPQASRKGLEIGLLEMARLYQEGRTAVKKRTANGVYTVNIAKVAEAAKKPTTLLDQTIEFNKVGEDADAVLSTRKTIDVSAFQSTSLADIPGKSIIPIGIGGGSDVIQAAQLGFLLPKSKNVPGVISVRSLDAASRAKLESIATAHPEALEIVSDGIVRVKRDSAQYVKDIFSSGRFLEEIIADEVPTYLVIDEQNGSLTARLQTAVKTVGGAETLLAVDTGGDALYSSTGMDGAKATPDQDLRVLKALDGLTGIKTMTAEVAVGVDSPDNAQDVLQKAGSTFAPIGQPESQQVLGNYKRWKMDGSDDSRFGKTSLAFQSALEDKMGLQVVPLPRRVVLDSKNPWNPFVHIQPSMKGVFLSNLQGHMSAIGIEPIKR